MAAVADADAQQAAERSEETQRQLEAADTKWAAQLSKESATAAGTVMKLQAKLKDLRKYVPPQAPETEVTNPSSQNSQKQREYRDRVYLRTILNEREFRLHDLAMVLNETGYLYHLMFNCREGWEHLMYFLRYNETYGIENTWHVVWSARLPVKLKTEYGLSMEQIEGLRFLVSHQYTRGEGGSLGMTQKRPWIINPFNESDIIYFPAPIVSKNKWFPVWQEIKQKIGFGLSANGKVALKDFKVALREQINADRALLPALSTFTEAWPLRLTLSPDACGVWSYKLLHFLLRMSSYLPSVHRNSEKRGTTVLVAHSGDHHADLISAAVETGFADVVDDVNDEGRIDLDGAGGDWVPLAIYFSADKPATEGLRGCGQCCAWCYCSKGMLHVIPFELDKLPADYKAWLAGLASIKVADGAVHSCRYPVKTEAASVLAHVPKRGETLPSPCLAKGCPCYRQLPFKSVEEMDARIEAKRAALKGADTEKKRNALAAERSAFARLHMNQHELARPIFRSANSDRVVVEYLHMLYLNVPKSFNKWAVLRHLGEPMRARYQAWFKSVGISLDFRERDKGRAREQKWCSGDQWARIIKGCKKNPNGLIGLAAFSVNLLVEQHCLDLETDDADSQRLANASLIRQQWTAWDPSALSVEQITARLASLLGVESSRKLIVCLQGFDALHELMCAVNDDWVDERDSSEREARAFRAAIAGIKLAWQWEAASVGRHRSWYMHIMLYIMPRQIAELGDLWRFSSGPLEARGARLQRAVRTNFTFRPTSDNYRGNTLTNAANMVEASKFLKDPELDTRRQNRLDYFGRVSRIRAAKPGTAVDDSGPSEPSDAMTDWALVKMETPTPTDVEL